MTGGSHRREPARGHAAKLKAIVPAERVSNDPLEDRIEVSDPRLLGAPVTEVYRVRDGDAAGGPGVAAGGAGRLRRADQTPGVGAGGRRLGGVRVIEHHETPGLGDKIDEKKDDWIIEQFNGKSLDDPLPENWQVKRDGGDVRSVHRRHHHAALGRQGGQEHAAVRRAQGEALYQPPTSAAGSGTPPAGCRARAGQGRRAVAGGGCPFREHLLNGGGVG
jgi:electron transport complex protein RnfG